MKNEKIKKNRGALLLELLVVISVLAVIFTFAANAVFLSMRSSKSSGGRDIATSLATESLEAVRAVTEENWKNIYDLTKSTVHYHPTQSSGKWTLTVTGDEIVTLNGVPYTRYLIVENVCRDNTTREVASCGSGSSDDPSTQKITVTVSWVGGTPVSVFEYFFRWKNVTCPQLGWSTGNSGNTVITNTNCPSSTTYDTKDSSIDTTHGPLKLLQ